MSDIDQSLAEMRDTVPRVWWALYCGSVDAGFSSPQAMALLQTWILGQNPGGIRPPEGGGSEK